MTVHSADLAQPEEVHRSFRLTRPRTPAGLESQVRPALVLPERDGRALIAAAQTNDVGRGGAFSAGPAGIQVWDGPWNGAGGSHGSAKHLGSVNWSYDTPIRHYITIYRVLVTPEGIAAGESTDSVLARVLAVAGLGSAGETLNMPPAQSSDPFRRASLRPRR